MSLTIWSVFFTWDVMVYQIESRKSYIVLTIYSTNLDENTYVAKSYNLLRWH